MKCKSKCKCTCAEKEAATVKSNLIRARVNIEAVLLFEVERGQTDIYEIFKLKGQRDKYLGEIRDLELGV